MTPTSPLAYRRSLEDRLRVVAAETGRDLGWVRRRHVFIRVLHRLVGNQPDRWVLKGGFAVELRRPGLARATRDIDLTVRTAGLAGDGQEALQSALASALARDVDGDGFGFAIGRVTPLAEDAYGRPAWRFSVDAALAGKSFVAFHLDVVERPEELVELTTLALPAGTAPPPGAGPRVVVVTDLRQQFAEKLHALTRSYATGESTRVKDLLDIVLLAEDGLQADRRLHEVVRRIFTVRGTSELPGDLGPPPLSWEGPFRLMAGSIGLPDLTAPEAGRIAAAIWLEARAAQQRKES